MSLGAMSYRKRFYFLSMVAISILFLRSFPRIDMATWSFLLMTKEETNFLRIWCRLQRAQLDVNVHVGPCQSCALERNSPLNCSPGETTDIQHSYVSRKNIRPAGDFSRLFIKTRNTSGHLKSNGGDTWKVYLRGPSFLSATIFDFRNGTYEVIFLPVLPGRYIVNIVLINTICNGVLTPTKLYSDLGHIEHRIVVPEPKGDLVLYRLQFHMKFRDRLGPSIFNYQRCCGFCASCNFLWNGYGTWENEQGKLKWRPYIKMDDRPRKVNYRERAIRKNGSLWFFGDKISNIYNSVRNRPLCKKIFINCENPTFLYPKQDVTSLSLSNITRLVLNSFQTLVEYSLQLPENALILNGGFLAHLPYKSYVVLIDKIAQLLHNTSKNSSVRAQIIWSTMTSTPGNRHNVHFPVYNAYANWRMCNAKIPILDLFPLSDSYPTSFNKKRLESNAPFESVERLLEDFFERTADR